MRLRKLRLKTMSAADLLKQKNGLKTTQSVLQKQQSGRDAAQKQMPVFSQSQLDAAGKKIDAQNAAVPKDETPSMKEARLRTIANQKGVENGINMNGGVAKNEEDKPSIPIVKKSEPENVAASGNEKKEGMGMSYADMFKMINPDGKAKNEKDEKRERTRMRIAAIGDGLRALSNIYFATNGAKVIHNPEQDLTGSMLKRKQMMDAQREKNRSAWINGYQRALALDEEARKNDRTISEQIRHNKELEAAAKQKANQGDTRLAQSQQRLDLSKMKYKTDADYKNSVLKIKDMLAKGQIAHWQAQEAIQRMNAESGRIRANKTGSGGRNGSYSGEIDEYMDLMSNDPDGMAEAGREVAKMGLSTKTAAGRKAQKIAYKKKHGGGAAKGGSKGGTTTGGKKKTGVNWK